MIPVRRLTAAVVRVRAPRPCRVQGIPCSPARGGVSRLVATDTGGGIVPPIAGGTRGTVSDGAGRPASGGYAPGDGSRSFAPHASASPIQSTAAPRSMADRTAASAALARDRTPPEMLAGEDLHAAGRVQNISVANERAGSAIIGDETEGIPISGPAVVLGKEGQPGMDVLGTRAKGEGGQRPLSGASRLQNSGSGDLHMIGEVNRRARADYIGDAGSSGEMDVAGDAAIGAGEYPANPQAISNVPRAPWTPTSSPSGH